MTEHLPARDEGDESPDELIGEETVADHDLDPSAFDEEADEDGDQS